MSTQNQITPVKPVATVNAGGIWESINGGLSSALDLWGRVEQIKGRNSASGNDQLNAMYRPEMANGAAVQLDQNLQQKSDDSEIFGVKINKPLLIGGAVLLGFSLLLVSKGYR